MSHQSDLFEILAIELFIRILEHLQLSKIIKLERINHYNVNLLI